MMRSRRTYDQRSSTMRSFNSSHATYTRLVWLMRRPRSMIHASNAQRFGGTRIRKRLRHYNILRIIVRTTRAEHERIDTHTHMPTLRLDALPHEHASALDATNRTGLLTDFEILTALQLIHRQRGITIWYAVSAGCSQRGSRWQLQRVECIRRTAADAVWLAIVVAISIRVLNVIVVVVAALA